MGLVSSLLRVLHLWHIVPWAAILPNRSADNCSKFRVLFLHAGWFSPIAHRSEDDRQY